MYQLIDPQFATGESKELLDATLKQLGKVPNLYRAMANSPKALAAYLAFRAELQDGVLDAPMRERIALLTAQLNHCHYCVAAHSFRFQKLGFSEEEVLNTRKAISDDPKIVAALLFVVELISEHGLVSIKSKEQMMVVGWTEEEVGEMVAHVALNIFSNFFKHTAEPELDFPDVPVLDLS